MRVRTVQSLRDELYLLSAALTEGEFSWLGSNDDIQRWDAALKSHVSDDLSSVLSSSQLRDTLGQAQLSVSLVDPQTAHVALLISAFCPAVVVGSDGPVSLELSIFAPDFTSSHAQRADWIAALRQELATQVAAQCESYVSYSVPEAVTGSHAADGDTSSDPQRTNNLPLPPDEVGGQLFDLYTILRDWINLHSLPPATSTDSTCISDETPLDSDHPGAASSSATEEMKSSIPMALRVHMYRQIFWTHHLLSKEKQRQLTSWADELGVWLVVKTGYPGFLLLEGPKCGLAQSSTTDATAPPPSASASSAGAGALELSRRIRAMQWAKLTTKTRTEWTWSAMADLTLHNAQRQNFDAAECAALLACPLARACRHPLNQLTGGGVFTTAPPFLPSEDPTRNPTFNSPHSGKSSGKKGKRARSTSPGPGPDGAVSNEEYAAAWDKYTKENVLSQAKTRTCLVKTESVGNLVLLLRRAGLSETEIIGGLGVRHSS